MATATTVSDQHHAVGKEAERAGEIPQHSTSTIAAPPLLLISEDDYASGCERLGKLLFLQVDPTLRNLLAVLQRQQEMVEQEVIKSSATSSSPTVVPRASPPSRLFVEVEEQRMELFKAEADLLMHLQRIVSEFPSNIIKRSSSSTSVAMLEQQISSAMTIMMDYISLPLVAILRRPVTTRNSNNTNGDGSQRQAAVATTTSRRLQIRQGAERKSIGVAANTLQICLESIRTVAIARIQDGEKANNNTNNNSPHFLAPHKILQLILACASALPSGQDIAEQSIAGIGVIDRGEDHLEPILLVTNTLLRMGAMVSASASAKVNNDSNDKSGTIPTTTCSVGDFGRAVLSAMDGALVAHLADVCLSIVSPPSVFHESTMLVAMEALQTMLVTTPDSDVWRGLFPGCFATLFRTLIVGLRGVSSKAQSKPKVVLETLTTFSSLLKLTLIRSDSTNNSRTEERGNGKLTVVATLKLLGEQQKKQQQLTSSATTTTSVASSSDNRKRRALGESSASYRNQQSTASDDDSTTNQKDGFLVEINSRLPGPLTVLIKLLGSAESALIRRRAAGFCQLLLIETRSIWDDKIQDDLSIMALESSLILTRDTDKSVTLAAQAVVNTYQQELACKHDMNAVLVPRILSMIEELPALAQRQSETDLRSKIKLISAFLSLNTTTTKSADSSPKTKKNGGGGGKALRSALAAENVSLTVRKALAELLDVDFATPNGAPAVSIELLNQHNLLDSKAHYHGSLRRKHLTPASEKETMAMVQGLGQILGPKHAAIFVDACVADMFNDCVARVADGNSRSGRSQEAWCHQWIGSLTLVREVLKGAFSDDSNKTESSKSTRKKLKYLSALATSVLPIIVSAPLWDLPVCPPDDFEPGNSLEFVDPIISNLLPSTADVFSSVALRGNAFFLCGLVQLVRSMVGLLQEEASPLIPTLLPPLLDHATTTKVPCVMEEAQAALEHIASAVGYSNLASMIDQNIGVVAGAMLATLRVPGGRSSMADTTAPAEISNVAHTIRSILQLILRESSAAGNEDESVQQKDASSYSYLLELVMTLTERYDCLASKTAFESNTTIAIVGVYESVFQFLINSYRVEECAARVQLEQRSPEAAQSWCARLDPFLILQVAAGSMDDDNASKNTSPREGFEDYHNNQQCKQEQDVEEAISSTNDSPVSSRAVGNHETNFVAILVSRCTFFFSNASLRLQVESCAAMTQGFRFLAIVALLCKDPEAKTGTAILRQVSDAWPVIHARLVALTTEIQSTRVSSIVVIRHSSTPTRGLQPTVDVSTKRVFVSRLLELVAIMVECSGGFMASRFKNDIFPLVSEVLGGFAEDCSPSIGVRDDVSLFDRSVSVRDRRFSQRCDKRQASETALIVAMIRCFVSIFRVRACGKALAGLIPAAGALVLPFLGEEGELGAVAMAAIQHMVQIDCDALWRPLIQISGRRQFPPPKKWLLLDGHKQKARSNNEVTFSVLSLLERRANELVDFIERLPEQELVY